MPCKALWLKEREPETYKNSARICEGLDWVTHRLTGERTASINTASFCWYFDRNEDGFPESLYEAVGLEDLLDKFPQKVLGLGNVVGELLNTSPENGFFFMPFVFVAGNGAHSFMSAQQLSTLTALVYGANIAANLFFGIFGDHFGWRRTVTVFGCIGRAVATPLWYFGSLALGSFVVSAILGMLYGVLLAGFVPLSALMPSMVARHDKGAALAILNVGAGAAAFVGVFIACILSPFIGYGGVVIAYAALYVVCAVLTWFIKDVSDPRERGEVKEKSGAATT